MKDSTFSPIDPEYVQRVKQSFDRQQIMHLFQAKLTKVAPARCEITLPFSDQLTQQHGFYHAGVVSTIADSAAGYAAFTLMAATSSVLTVEYKINLLAPARGDYLVAQAEVMKKGKTLSVSQTKVFAIREGESELCALGQFTLIEMKNRKDR